MKETPQQKYQRLLHEVQELTSEVEKIKVAVHHGFLRARAVRFSELGTQVYINAAQVSAV